MHLRRTAWLAFVIGGCRDGDLPMHARPDGFYGVYTRVATGASWEEAARRHSGAHADLVVRLGDDGELVFSQATSYLPRWDTPQGSWTLPELVPRTGDGPPERPDRIARYASVRLLESSTERAVVRWRYVPDFARPDWHGVVEETFTITPDGHVERVVRRATERLDDWTDPRLAIVETLELAADGIDERPGAPPPPRRDVDTTVAVAPVVDAVLGTPVRMWSFDEGIAGGDTARESVTATASTIAGSKARWAKGVSGTALQLDGYTTQVVLPAAIAPALEGGVTIEAWIALGARPHLDWAPVVHRSQWGREGFYLGVDPAGRIGFHAALADGWHAIVDDAPIAPGAWHHVAATHDPTTGAAAVYVDGTLRASAMLPLGPIVSASSDLVIGRNDRTMPAVDGDISLGNWPSWYGFDGLIDEVRIHDLALLPDQIAASFSTVRPDAPELAARRLPSLPRASTPGLSAEYTRLDYHQSWDDLWRLGDDADIVVHFDPLPVALVFWHGMSYGPAFVSENGRWIGDQSSEDVIDETIPGQPEGFLEHMSDKQCRYSHVRIIENTPARVVVHWRYAMVDTRYRFAEGDPEDEEPDGWGEWADEYWTIYPDATAVRFIARGRDDEGGWSEPLVFSQPGERPEDVLELAAYTAIAPDGEQQTLSWESGLPELALDRVAAGIMNTKSEWRAFHVLPDDNDFQVMDEGNELGTSRFTWWNHFPVAQIVSDGNDALTTDHPSHSALVWPVPGPDVLIYGMTDGEAAGLLPLARTWNHPPEIHRVQGGRAHGYERSERAWQLEIDAAADRLSFEVASSSDRPLLNPAFVVAGWSSDRAAEITVEPAADDVRQGIVRATDGTQTLVVWLRASASAPRRVTIARRSE